MEKRKDTAVLVVSFGSTHLDTLERCIEKTESAIMENFCEDQMYRAFLSPTVIRRLRQREGIFVDSVPDALDSIRRDGYQKVLVQPTLLLAGFEYDLLVNQLKEHGRMLRISMGRPLIEQEQDCRVLADIIMEENPLQEKEALVLMGHGTEHAANAVYPVMQKIFEEKKYNAVITTVESEPAFEEAVEKVKVSGAVKVFLLPLMFVAGDHAKNDMAGDQEDSLLSLMEKAGIVTVPILRGLGESQAVRGLYARRAQQAWERL